MSFSFTKIRVLLKFFCRLLSKEGRYAIELERFAYSIPNHIGKEIEKTGNLKEGWVRLGVRPGDVNLFPQKVNNAFWGKVILTEPVGESIIYHIEIGEKLRILAEVPAEADISAGGERVGVKFNPEKLHFFHPKAGKALYT